MQQNKSLDNLFPSMIYHNSKYIHPISVATIEYTDINSLGQNDAYIVAKLTIIDSDWDYYTIL